MDIKELVRQILSDIEILDLTGDNTVHFLHAIDPMCPYVEYEIVDEYGDEYAENEEKFTKFLVQVDIFSNDDYSDLETKIKEKMKVAGFERGFAADLYENDTKLYHKAMRFSISLETNKL